MLSIRITQRQDQCFALRINCAETEVFKASVATLKAMIPAAQRFFDFRMRYWVIAAEAEEHLPPFLARMQSLFDAEVEVVAETDEERAARETTARSAATGGATGGQHEHERAQGEGTRGARAGRSGSSSSSSSNSNSSSRHRRLRVARRLDVESACRTLHLAPGAPLEVVQAVYRTLAKLHHPDVGGSNEVMAEINDAYNYLVDALKKSANVA